MARNIPLSQFLASTVNTFSTGTKVFSLSSQILEKTQMYLSEKDPESSLKRGINGFMLDIVKETIVELKSDITDYPLETEEKLQSHYSKSPVRITITGVCSDIRVHDPNDNWGVEQILDDLNEMTDKLTNIAGAIGVGKAVQYGTRVSSYMNTVHVLYRKVKETANRLTKVIKMLGLADEDREEAKSSQIRAFEYLEHMWSTGALLYIETPYKVYDNCVIESLSFTQPEETHQQTMIDITFKQLTLIPAAVGFQRAEVDQKAAIQFAETEKKNNPNGSGESVATEMFIGTYNQEIRSGDKNGRAARAMEDYLQEHKLNSAKQVSSSALR